MRKLFYKLVLIIAFLGYSTSIAQTSINLNGTNQYFQVPTGNFTEYTIETWVKLTGSNVSKNILCLSVSDPNAAWSHQLRTTSTGCFEHYTFDNNLNSTTGTTPATLGVWYHVAIVAQNNGLIKLYVNGIQEGSSVTIGTMWAGGSIFCFGQNAAGGGLGFMQGSLDEIRIWNVAKTQNQIQATLNKTVSPSSANLVAYYRGSSFSGATVTDLTANGRNGTIFNGAGTSSSNNPVFSSIYGTGSSINATCAGNGVISVSNPPVASSQTLFNNDFSLTAAAYNITLVGSASISGGEGILNPLSGSGDLIFPLLANNPSQFTATFDYRTFDGTGADGFCFNYGIVSGSGYEFGIVNPGLAVGFSEYSNSAQLMFNGNIVATTPLSGIANSSYRNIRVTVNSNNLATVTLAGTAVFTNVALPASYATADKTNWKCAFSSRTGAATNKHSIDNFQFIDNAPQFYSINGTNWQRSTTFSAPAGTYNLQGRLGDGIVSGITAIGSVTISSSSFTPTITASGSTSFCTGNSVNLTSNPSASNKDVAFNGAFEMNCGNNASLQLNSGTIEAWIKTGNAGSSYRGIVIKSFAYNIFMLNNQIYVHDWTSQTPAYTGVTLNDNTWHHIALSFQDGVANGSQVYIDGVASGSPFTLNLANHAYPLLIGNNFASPQQFNGEIDEVRIWNTLRNASQLAASKNSVLPAGTAGLVSYYRFDEGSGNSTADLTGNGNNGTFTSTPSWQSSTSPLNYYTYLWSPGGATTQTITVSAANTYSVVATDLATSCVGNASQAVTIIPNNTVGAASSTPTLCINTPLTAITHSTTVATGIGTATGLPSGVTATWTSNTITISGTPTVAGTFSYIIPLTGGCGNVSASGTISVTPDNTASAPSSSPTLCSNSSLIPITFATTGATGIGTATGLPSGVTAVWSSNTISISGTPTSTGTFNYSIPLTGGCGNVSAVGAIVVYPEPTVNAVANQSVCNSANFSGISFTGGNNSYSWINSNPSIGIAASGEGMLPSFTATNNTAVTSSGTITVTPVNKVDAYAFVTDQINDVLYRIDTRTNSIITSIPVGDIPRGVAISPDGNKVYVLNFNSSNISVISATTNTVIATIPIVSNPVSMSLTPDGSKILLTNASTNVIIINTNTNLVSSTIPLSVSTFNNVQAQCIHPSGTKAYISTALGTIAVIDLVNNIALPAISVSNAKNLAISPDGNTLYYYDGFTLKIYDLNTNSIIGSISLGGGTVSMICLSPDGSKLYLTRNTINKIDIIDTNTKLIVGQINLINPNSLSFNSDGSKLFVTNGIPLDNLTVVNTANNSVLSNLTFGSQLIPFGNFISNTTFCTGNPTSFTITVNPSNSAGAPSSTPTVCINTPLVNITHSTTGASGIGTATGLPSGVTAAWASNTITISGTPSIAGTFNYSIPLTGGCGNITASGTITVSPNNTVGTASSAPTLCINTPLTAITHSTTGASGIGAATGLPSGVTATWASNAITISGTPTASGTFNYSIPLTGGCGSLNATGTITVTPNNTASAASTAPILCINTPLTAITHSTTGASGIGTATGLPSGVTATWALNTITISGTPNVAGTFTYSIPLTGGCGLVNATGTITVNPTSTVSAASSSPTLCVNTPITSITHNTFGASGIGTASGLPSGVTPVYTSTAVTLNGTNQYFQVPAGVFTEYTIETWVKLTGSNASKNIVCATVTDPTAAWSHQLRTDASGHFEHYLFDGGSPSVAGTTVAQLGVWYHVAIVAKNGSPMQIFVNGVLEGTGPTVGTLWSGPAIFTFGQNAAGTFGWPALNNMQGSLDEIRIWNVAKTQSQIQATMNSSVSSSSPNLFSYYKGSSMAGAVVTDLSLNGRNGTLFNGFSTSVSNFGTITISGTPTSSGNFAYSIPTTGGCLLTASGTITVLPSNTVDAASSTPTLCINSPLTAITHNTTGATGIGTASGLPSGVTAAWSSNTITISGTPIVSGTFNYSIPLTGGCGTASAIGTIAVLPQLTWYLDADNDGHYLSTLISCSSPGSGYYQTATILGDCNDADNSVWQSAVLFIDVDGDGYDNGDALICYGNSIPTGYTLVTLGFDCDDTNASIHPGAIEICNGVDEDCNGIIDDGLISSVTPNTSPSSYTENLENTVAPALPCGILVANENFPQDAFTWYTSTVAPHGGTKHLRIDKNTNNVSPKDDWFFSNPMNLQAGRAYRIYFWHRVSANGSEPFQVFVGNLPDAASMLLNASSFSGASNQLTYKFDSTADLLPAVNGTYYYGFHASAAAGGVSLYLDDIQVREIPTITLNPSSCTTLPSMNDQLTVQPVSGAQDYKFHIVNSALSYNYEFTRNAASPDFRLKWAPGVMYSYTYDVSVAYKKNNMWSAYGPSCPVGLGAFPIIKLKAVSCNTTLSDMNTQIYTDSVDGANDYEYRIVQNSIAYDHTWQRGLPLLDYRLYWAYQSSPVLVDRVPYGFTYDVQVRALVGRTGPAQGNLPGEWGTFGPVCTVTLAGQPQTQLKPTSCGITLANISDQIFCLPVTGASNYRYHVVNTALGYDVTAIRNSSLTDYRLTWLPTAGGIGVSYNTTYNITVSDYVGGTWSTEGPVCQVTTPPLPLTQLQATYCNYTLPTFSTTVNCVAVAGATNYRYHIFNTTTGYNKVIDRNTSLTDFKFSWTLVCCGGQNMLPNTSYQVEVASYSGGAWSAYGPICTITTGASVPRYSEFLAQDGLQNTAIMLNLTAYPNPASLGEEFSLVLDGLQAGNQRIDLNIYNLLGERVYRSEFTTKEESRLVIKPELALSAGVYLIETYVNGIIIREKFVVK